jgi:hypothetical protein
VITWIKRQDEKPAKNVRLLIIWNGKVWIGTYTGKWYLLAWNAPLQDGEIEIPTREVSHWAYIMHPPMREL